MQFIENAKNIKAMVIMVQEEVAYRLASKESTSDYGAITVAINLRGSAKVVMRVPREKFTPAPNVDSAVVKILPRKAFDLLCKPKVTRTCVRRHLWFVCLFVFLEL